MKISIKVLFICVSILFSSILFGKEQIIANIKEASGITFSKKSHSFFVVSDEGMLYELSLKGDILRSKQIGSYDFEGITIDETNDLLILLIEGIDNILILDKRTFKINKQISIKRKYKQKTILKKNKKRGLEGIVLIKNKLYLSNQSYKPYPSSNSSVIVIVDYNLNKNKLKIKNIINHGMIDIAGLTFHNNFLYMISDTKNLLIKYDFKNKTIKIIKKLNKKYAQEGIAFDNNDNLYIADDNGYILRLDTL